MSESSPRRTVARPPKPRVAALAPPLGEWLLPIAALLCVCLLAAIAYALRAHRRSRALAAECSTLRNGLAEAQALVNGGTAQLKRELTEAKKAALESKKRSAAAERSLADARSEAERLASRIEATDRGTAGKFVIAHWTPDPAAVCYMGRATRQRSVP